jgi:hypothetical protein
MGTVARLARLARLAGGPSVSRASQGRAPAFCGHRDVRLLRSSPVRGSVDVAEPPRIVFESSAHCADGSRAGELLKQMLAPARTPGHEWVVSMRIETTAPGDLRAEGEITNEEHAAVGHRTFTGKASDCRGLARAMGVWASLVLDGEANHPRSTASTSDQPAGGSGPSGTSGAALDAQRGTTAQTAAKAPEARPPPAQTWPPTPEPAEKPWRRDDAQGLELGIGGFLMAGTGGLLVGATPFLFIEVAKGFFLRPAIVIGAGAVIGARASPVAGEPAMTLGGGRLDGCLRVVGLYSNLQGLQFDLCGGVDAGVVDVSSQMLPYVAVGPSMDLRGDLGGGLAITLRGIVGVHVVRDVSMDLMAGRGELAMSWSAQ